MQGAVGLRVDVTIEQIENEHLQNLLVFRLWIIWGGTKNLGVTAPECPRKVNQAVVYCQCQTGK